MPRFLVAILTGVLAGCALGTSPPAVMAPSASPSAATPRATLAPPSPSLAVAASTPATLTPSPTPSPPQWFTATFTHEAAANADTSPFDTQMRDAKAPSSGGVFATWREQNDYAKPYPKAFVIEARWFQGMAPPFSKARRFELRFLEPPAPGERFDLRTDAVSRSTVQLTYHQGYRFRQDVWAATRGTLSAQQADGGTIRLLVTGAAMAPDPRGGDYESQATGTFEVDGEGVALPQDAYSRTEPDQASPAPLASPAGPDLDGLWTFAIPGASPSPIPACGAAYRRFTFVDPEHDGRDVTVTIDVVDPPGGDSTPAVHGELRGGRQGDQYVFEGLVMYSGPEGEPTPTREIYRLRYDEASGALVGDRQVGASVEEGGRGALPVGLIRPRFEAPPPDGCLPAGR